MSSTKLNDCTFCQFFGGTASIYGNPLFDARIVIVVVVRFHLNASNELNKLDGEEDLCGGVWMMIRRKTDRCIENGIGTRFWVAFISVH